MKIIVNILVLIIVLLLSCEENTIRANILELTLKNGQQITFTNAIITYNERKLDALVKIKSRSGNFVVWDSDILDWNIQ